LKRAPTRLSCPPVRFTLQLPTDRVDRGDEFTSGPAVAEMARAAEAAGFDACFVTDHPFPSDRWLASGGHHALDPFVALSFAAAATTRLRVQTHIAVLAYRNPFLTAKALASLDVLSGGRAILGVGAGYLRGEFEALGVDFDERNELCDEALVAIQRAWSEDGVRLEGRHFRARGNSMRPRPLQRPRPPIWVGGNSRRAIRRAVELADGWIPFPTVGLAPDRVRTARIESTDDLRPRLAYAREHARAVGRETPLDVCFAPIGVGLPRDGQPAPEPLREAVAEMAALGVTWLAVSLRADTRAGYCERVQALGATLAGLP
jgi:probable F420-dependent oxidoreductase